MLNSKEKRRLRQVAHHLQPVVTVAERGVTDALIEEARRALHDHEIIKAKVNVADRDARRSFGEALASSCESEIVQVIGKVWVLYRPNPDADPRLSNIARFS
ncbi:MAG TPA: ribosome assembly RNA-binding protein YhbY [Pseudomonadales bacterium]|nr:ribosome assembly RNA-binding protein YhbY [Pseudomonadales bacterium]